jgi:PUA-domain protein
MMSQKYRRYSLKTKESKQILLQASGKMKLSLEPELASKANVEIVESDDGQLYLIQGKPLLFRTGNLILPTLLATDLLNQLPKVVVDMGAIRFICNGADVMAPGIRRFEGKLEKGDIVVIVDEKHGKPIALGEMLLSLEEAHKAKQGAIIKSKHYVSDKIWDFVKRITE